MPETVAAATPPAAPRLTRGEALLFAAFLAGFLLLGAYTVPDYGPSWDVWELYVGDHALRFYTTLDSRTLDFRQDDIRLYDRPTHPDFHEIIRAYRDIDVQTAPHLIWPFGPLTSSVTKWVFYAWLDLFGVYDAHHLAAVFWATFLLAALFFFARRNLGRWAAWFAVLGVAAYPRFWGEVHNNVKDVPAAALFTLCLAAFHRGLLGPVGLRPAGGEGRGAAPDDADGPARGPDAGAPGCALWLVLSAMLWGLGLATKANALFLPFVLIPWFALVLWQRRRAGQPLLARREVVALAAYPVIGLGTMFAAWPYLLLDFPHHLQQYWGSLVKRGYEGGGGWSLMPLENAVVTMPLPLLLALAGGLLTIVILTCRRRRLGDLHVLLLLWLVIPVLRVSVPGANDFDGIRHWLEFIPAALLVAGLGVQAAVPPLARRLTCWRPSLPQWRARLAVALATGAVLLTPPVAWDVRNHPFQICFYNRLVGGLGGAQARGLPDATDYWCNSYRQGLEWINRHAPPNSVLAVGVAEHLLWFTREVWLREGIEFKPLTNVPLPVIENYVTQQPGRVFLMYVTREGWYHPIVRRYDGKITPVCQFTVDGGVILRILQLRPLPPAPDRSAP